MSDVCIEAGRVSLHLDVNEFKTPAAFHDWIAQALDFPAYYGGNFAALSDCLEDLGQPIDLEIDSIEGVGDDMRTFFAKVVVIIQRCNAQLEA